MYSVQELLIELNEECWGEGKLLRETSSSHNIDGSWQTVMWINFQISQKIIKQNRYTLSKQHITALDKQTISIHFECFTFFFKSN